MESEERAILVYESYSMFLPLVNSVEVLWLLLSESNVAPMKEKPSNTPFRILSQFFCSVFGICALVGAALAIWLPETQGRWALFFRITPAPNSSAIKCEEVALKLV